MSGKSVKKKKARIYTSPGGKSRLVYPEGKIRNGRIVDTTEYEYTPNRMYRTQLQLIRYNGEPERFVRFAYWRRVKNKKTGRIYYHWASQTTWAFSTKDTAKAIKAAIKKRWFRI